MTQYIIRRILISIPHLLLVSIVLFLLVEAAPGGPCAGQGRQRHVQEEKLEACRKEFGLDDPIPVRYWKWLSHVVTFDWGDSFITRRPVIQEIGERLPNTVYLMGVSFIVIILISIPVGIISAIKQYSFFDILMTTISFMGQAIPEFWFGLILILIFYSWLKILPPGGMASDGPFSLWDRIQHLILPVGMLTVGWIAWFSRFLRASMLEVISQDYIRTARAKGLREFIVLMRHAFKNATIPLVTIVALDLPLLFGGALYSEIIFSWPGMGRLYYQSAVKRDYNVLMAILVIEAALVVFFNLLADIIYGVLDPRVRYE